MTIAPCKGCQDRCAEPNCHTTCTRYISWAEEKRTKDEEIQRVKRVVEGEARPWIRRKKRWAKR